MLINNNKLIKNQKLQIKTNLLRTQIQQTIILTKIKYNKI